MYKMFRLNVPVGTYKRFTGTLWKSRKTRKTTLKLWSVGGKWLGGMGLGKELKKWQKRHRAKEKRRKRANEAGTRWGEWECVLSQSCQ
jgi:hypothetical protein